MTLVLLLALAGNVAAVETQTVRASRGAAAVPEPVVDPAALPGNPFAIAPLKLGRSLLKSPFQLPHEPRLDVAANQEPIGSPQSRNAPPRVVCTMRIVKAGGSLDPGFVVSLPPGPGPPDPIVRDDISPCIE